MGKVRFRPVGLGGSAAATYGPARVADHRWSEAARAEPITWIIAGRGTNRVVPGERLRVREMPFGSLAVGGAPYRFAGGLADARHGTELLVEGPPARAGAVLDGLARTMDMLPRELFTRIDQIRVYARQDASYDRQYAGFYRIPGFQAVAAGGDRRITFFGGEPYSTGVFLHEVGHNVRVPLDAWRSAIESDDRTIARLAARGRLESVDLEPIPDPVRHARWAPRLAPGGLSVYSHDRIAQGLVHEDVAEGVRFVLMERVFGRAFAVQHRSDGTTRSVWFDQAFPARARLVEDVLAGVRGVTPASVRRARYRP